MTHLLCYISTSKSSTLTAEIRDLMNKSCQKNIKSGISGILLFRQGTFFQILEGDKILLDELYQVIQEDERHKNLIILMNKKSESQFFDQYGLGFTTITNKNQINSFRQFITEYKNYSTELTSTFHLMKPFIT